MYRRESVPQSGLLRTGVVERGRGMGTVGTGQRGRQLTKEKLTPAEIQARKAQQEWDSKTPLQQVGSTIMGGVGQVIDVITTPLKLFGGLFGL